MCNLLYKFGTAESAFSILGTNTLWATDPMDFNDPFEIFPAFDDERTEVALASRNKFGRTTNAGDLGSITQSTGEDFPGFAGLNEECHGCFFPYVSERYRVICFNQDPTNILMWSHYGCSHKGIAIGFDITKGGFPTGIVPQGLPVKYVQSREKLKLPLHAYYFEALRELESRALPEGWALHDGICVPKAFLEKQYEDAIIQILRYKYKPWEYESELRCLYDLHSPNRCGLTRRKLSTTCKADIEKDVAHFADEAVQEIRLGCCCPPKQANELFALLTAGRFPHARLYMTELHQFEFKITFREVTKNEMLNGYILAKPGTWRGRPRI